MGPLPHNDSSIATALAALLWSVAFGCGAEPGEGSLTLDNVQSRDRTGDCLERAFPLEPSFFAQRDRADSVGVFLQSSTDLGQNADLLYIEVYTPDRFRNNSGSTIRFEYPTTTSSPARVEVDTYESCPDHNVSLAVQGELAFESLPVEPGERVRGRLEGGTILDARTGRTVAAGLSGSWDFPIETGSPYRSFPPQRDYPSGVEP